MRCIGRLAVLVGLAWAGCSPAMAEIVYSKPPPVSAPQESPSRGYRTWEDEASAPPSPQPGQAMISSGTGFFVSNRGHIITNEHVVTGCRQVMIRGAVNPMIAEVVDRDEEYDLALLRAEIIPQRIAAIRRLGNEIGIGDSVLVIGYPLDSGVTGVYKVAEAQILDVRGPMNEPQWIQFSDAAQQGNSGGPLLDTSGNVVGVVVGKTKLTAFDPRSAQEKILKRSDIAISLPVLKRFLHKNRIYFRAADSWAYLALPRIEAMAQEYIVNIHCQKN